MYVPPFSAYLDQIDQFQRFRHCHVADGGRCAKVDPIGLYPLSGITGTMLGSFIWGWLGNHIGRRASILLAAIIFIATSTCGTMPEYWMNLITCFCMGLGVGGMLPIAFALLSETVPKKHRGWIMVLIGSDIAGAYIIVSWYALLVVPVWGISVLNAVLAVYTAEMYPTVVRARSSGLSVGVTKAGGVLILTLVVAAVAAPSVRMTAAVGVIPMGLAAIAVIVFGPETRHKQLEQITADQLRRRLAYLCDNRAPIALRPSHAPPSAARPHLSNSSIQIARVGTTTSFLQASAWPDTAAR